MSFRSAAFTLFAVALATTTGCFEAELNVAEPFPVADAGFDQIRFLNGQSSIVIDLDGRGSCDPLGDVVSDVVWELVDGPNRTAVNGTSKYGGLFDATMAGEYLVSLRITSGGRMSAPDYVLITVNEGAGEDEVVAVPSTDACGRPLRGDG